MNQQLIFKFIKGYVIGIVPIILLTLKQHGCAIDNYAAFGQDLALALIPGFGHAIYYFVFPPKA